MIPERNERVETPTRGDRREAGRRILVGAGVGIALFAGGVGGYLLARASLSRPGVVATPTPSPTRTESSPGSAQRQTAARRLSALAASDFSPFDPVREDMRGFVAPITFSPPYETVNSAVFDTAEYRIRLARIRPIGRDEVCFDQAQFRFACGLMARAALQNALAGREVTCLPRFEVASRTAHRFVADCRTAAGDLAEGLVRKGFALPTEPDDRRLFAALEAARTARRGVWAGPYVEAEADPTAEDEHDVPFAGARPREAPIPPTAAIGTAVEPPATTDGATATRDDPPPPRPIARPSVRETPKRAGGPPTRRPPTLEELAPNATQQEGVNVVAGPIQPPSPELARRLGVVAPVDGSETIRADSSSNR
ncbi:MAG: hypothetical protein LWW93_13770 [Hyphomicrobiales bacterium]|nr:hypothetical protein [Hyphomicrobiales bacterium]